MTVVFRHVARELVALLLLMTIGLSTIALGGRFIGYLQDAAMGKFGADAVFVILSLRIPEFLQLTLPIAFYLSCVLVVSRSHADHEATVLWGAGVSPGRFLGWLLAIGVVVAAAEATLTTLGTPAAHARLAAFVTEERSSREFESITPGVFHAMDRGRAVTYAEGMSADRRELLRVFIAQHRADRPDLTIWAERATQSVAADGSRFLHLENGRRYQGDAGALDFNVVEFRTSSQRVEPRTVAPSRPEEEAIATGALDLANPRTAAEWHWRIALPVATALGVVAAFALGRVPPRESRFARLPLAILVFFLYYVVILFNHDQIVEGTVPPAVGLWPSHLAFAIASLFLLRRPVDPVLRRPR